LISIYCQLVNLWITLLNNLPTDFRNLLNRLFDYLLFAIFFLFIFVDAIFFKIPLNFA
jgi:hypothetical protein